MLGRFPVAYDLMLRVADVKHASTNLCIPHTRQILVPSAVLEFTPYGLVL